MTEYLSDTLGWAFAEAVNIDGDTVGGFLDKLSRSGILADIEAHAPYCTTGCTGSELTRKVKAALGDKNAPINQRYPGDQGAPYWIGYYLGWYHCRSGRPFAGILARFPIEGWYRMYQLYHECGEEKLYRDLEDEMEKYKNTVKT
jgi:hypothetical protein